MKTVEKNMDVTTAVKIAKEYAMQLFKEDGLSNFGLEEVEFDSKKLEWLITVGFSRPWSSARSPLAPLTGDNTNLKRVYRVVQINSRGEVLSVKRRPNDD